MYSRDTGRGNSREVAATVRSAEALEANDINKKCLAEWLKRCLVKLETRWGGRCRVGGGRACRGGPAAHGAVARAAEVAVRLRGVSD